MADKIDHLHPPQSAPQTIFDERVDGGVLCNIGAAVQMAREAGTPEGKRFYRAYVAEYRSRDGQALTHEQQEEEAFFATAKRVGWKIVDKGPL